MSDDRHDNDGDPTLGSLRATTNAAIAMNGELFNSHLCCSGHSMAFLSAVNLFLDSAVQHYADCTKQPIEKVRDQLAEGTRQLSRAVFAEPDAGDSDVN